MTKPDRRHFDKPWRKWYASARWRGPGGLRTRQLVKVPYCELCKAMGRATPASVVNHVVPHRGDPHRFWYGKLQSLCPPCHDGATQRAEVNGFTRAIGEDGFPLDPNHPFNRRTLH